MCPRFESWRGRLFNIEHFGLLTPTRLLKEEAFPSDWKYSGPLNIKIPSSAHQYGFVTTPGGTHTSRTMMFPELEMLLAACPPTASFADYEAAILEENILLKNTVSTRQRTLRGLRELYALDRSVLLFRAMLDLWDARGESHSLLALLCALTRDSLLRATIPVILTTAKGDEANSTITSQAITAAYPHRYNEATLGKIGRNTAATWTQSGHLVGTRTKIRNQVMPLSRECSICIIAGAPLWSTWRGALPIALDTITRSVGA